MADQTDVVDASHVVLGERSYGVGVVAEEAIGTTIQCVGHLGYRITGLFLFPELMVHLEIITAKTQQYFLRVGCAWMKISRNVIR